MPRERTGIHFHRKTQADDRTKSGPVGGNINEIGEGPDVFAKMEAKASKRQMVEKKKTLSRRRRGEKGPAVKASESEMPSEARAWQKRAEGREPVVSDQAVIKIVERLKLEGKPFSELLDNPEAAAWLEEFVARIGTGKKNEKSGAFNKVAVFFEEAALPKDILYYVGNLLDVEFEDAFGWDSKDKPVDLDSVQQKLGLNEEQTKLLFALVVLINGSSAVKSVTNYAREGRYDFLQKNLQVTREEADRISAIEPLANQEQYARIIEALIKKIGRVMTEKMTGEKMVHFLNNLHAGFREAVDFKFFESILGEDGKIKFRNEISARGARGFDVSLSVTVRYYEEIFGKLTLLEFLALVPNAKEAVAIDFAGKDLKKRLGLAEPEGPKQKSSDQEKVYEGKKVKVVKEKELLKLRAEANRRAEVPTLLFPPTVETRQLPGRTMPEARVAGLLSGESPPVLRVPLDRERLAKKYEEEIGRGIEKMKKAHEMAARTEVFLAEVWPQFLLARAQMVEIKGLEESLEEATQLLPSSVRNDLDKLVVLSRNTENKAGEIRAAARNLRNNSDLHNLGVYVWTELISRTREGIKGSESVDVLTAQSHRLDAIRDIELEGGPTRILYAGRRLDKVDRDYPAMGVNVKGDGQGVVFLEQVKNYVAHEIVPYLADTARLVVPEGKEIHPLHALKQEALRSEHGSGRAVNGEEVYKKAVWSTTVHEVRHEDDRRKGLGVHLVAMEYTAYLTSIATPAENGKPNQPLTDLIAVIDLYHENVAGLGRLGDMFGINEGAAAEILLGLAEKFGMGDLVNAEVLKNNHLDVCAAILKKAIEAGSEKLQKMAQELIDEYYVMPTLAEKAAADVGQSSDLTGKPDEPKRQTESQVEKVLPKLSTNLSKSVRGLPEHHVRPALTSASKKEKKPGRSLLNKLRETVFFTGLAAVLGILASQTNSEQSRSGVEKDLGSLTDKESSEVSVAAEPPEPATFDETMGSPAVVEQYFTEQKEIASQEQIRKAEIKALTTKGLYGYAVQKIGHTAQDEINLIKNTPDSLRSYQGEYRDKWQKVMVDDYDRRVERMIESLADALSGDVSVGGKKELKIWQEYLAQSEKSGEGHINQFYEDKWREECKKRISIAQKRVNENLDFGLRLSGDHGKDIEIVKEWSKTISEPKARQIVDLLAGYMPIR